MFEVGDEVVMCDDLPGLPRGAICKVVKVFYGNEVSGWFVDVEYEGQVHKTRLHSRFKLHESDGLSSIERKIRSMYARQFRKTGYDFFS